LINVILAGIFVSVTIVAVTVIVPNARIHSGKHGLKVANMI